VMKTLTCSTCGGTGLVECVDYDGSGYEQACPDCDRGFQVNGVIPAGDDPVPDEEAPF
jgi:transcription elongation factor Elf1